MTKKIFMAVVISVTLVISANADIEFFTSRTAFDAECPGIPVEDFEGLSGTPDGGGVDAFTATSIDSTTMEGPIAMGDILDGLELTSTGAMGMVMLNPNFGLGLGGVPSNIVGPLTFADTAVINFASGADAVGFDLSSFANTPGTIDAVFMDGDTVLGTTPLLVDTVADFVGAVTTNGDIITSVMFENKIAGDGNPTNGELFDNIAFRLVMDKFVLGDVNCDGVVDLLDVAPFVDLISIGGFSEKADINMDGVVDLLDVAPFVALLQG